MKQVFITGATGFVGQAICRELLDMGYRVIGLARREAAADKLRDMGINAVVGDVKKPLSLAESIDASDAVIHTAFNHDFSTFLKNCESDHQTILHLGEMLIGTAKPLIITSGAFYTGNEKNTLDDVSTISRIHNPRAASDEAALLCAKKGVNAMVVGLTQVHNRHKFGLISHLIDIAKEKEKVCFVSDGENKWAGVHLSDVASLFRLVMEKGQCGMKYMASADEAVPFKTIASVVGQKLNLPVASISEEEGKVYFGHFFELARSDLSVSSIVSRTELNWTPTGPTLFEDLLETGLAG